MGDRQLQEAPTDHHFSPLARKLVRFTFLWRWLLVALLWLILGSYGIWALRGEFALWRDHLTWAVVRLSLGYHYWASVALTICVAYTCAVLVWHSQKLTQGWSQREKYRFNQWAEKLTRNQQHWLWFFLRRL
ncbi:hypothetical protein [Synechococcus sp. BDU 130192]|uniref:hypothetical protein n=1 Tax=Synechococcus sp. BDU 130192 TaxID=2042059 RepID=UPI000C087AFD|nr:hypothetical protein [Synechococcus sp. BDU 130192]